MLKLTGCTSIRCWCIDWWGNGHLFTRWICTTVIFCSSGWTLSLPSIYLPVGWTFTSYVRFQSTFVSPIFDRSKDFWQIQQMARWQSLSHARTHEPFADTVFPMTTKSKVPQTSIHHCWKHRVSHRVLSGTFTLYGNRRQLTGGNILIPMKPY